MALIGIARGRFVNAMAPELSNQCSLIDLQAWPLTPAWGAMAGYVLGSLWAMTVTNVKEIVDLGISATETDALEDKVSKKKSKKKRRAATIDSDTNSRDSTTEFPEDPEGGLYGDTRRGPEPESSRESHPLNEDDIFNQEV